MMDSIYLAGSWFLAADPEDRGERERWFLDQRYGPRTPSVAADLPGSTDRAGIGPPVDGAATAHPVRRHAHVGPAWWQRAVELPAAWADRRVELRLERVHWTSSVWLDDVRLGRRDSLSTPHVYILPPGSVGRRRLTIRTDNRIHLDLGVWGDNAVAHSIGDHTQPNWNGICGRIELIARPRVCIAGLRTAVAADLRRATVELDIDNDACLRAPAQVRARLGDGPPIELAIALDGMPAQRVELALDAGPGAAAWDEHAPRLHRLAVELASAAGADRAERSIGLRRMGVEGTRLACNGRPLHLRGTLECCLFPATGHPPMERPAWDRLIATARDWGLNHLRFHSWCPPEAAFAAADAAGMLLQVEAPLWATLGGDDAVDRYLADESERILAAYGDHPSFVLFSPSNEPAGHRQVAAIDRWLRRIRADGRMLAIGGSGWPTHPRSDAHCLMQAGAIAGYRAGEGALRLNSWNQQRANALNDAYVGTRTAFAQAVAQLDRPAIAHEIGQWCAYPDYASIPLYAGSIVRPGNLERFRDHAAARGLLGLAQRMLHASGRLQTLAYKEEIEAHLRTPGIAGFQLLSLTDFTGQGTATVGPLDAFWRPKGYVDGAEWRRFCAPTVALAAFDRHCWYEDERIAVDLLAAHAGARPLAGVRVAWRLEDAAGAIRRSGELTADLPLATGIPCGRIAIDAAGLPAPAQLRLVVVLAADGATIAENDWPLFIYPRRLPADPPGVLVAERVDDRLRSHLAAGGAALLCPDPAALRDAVDGGFGPIFWNSNWAAGQKPDTLGLMVEDRHPALARFPTGPVSDWQWHGSAIRARPLILDRRPGLRPIVGVVDDWYRHHRLALIAEARIGPGRLAIAAADLRGDLAADPARRQLRHSLLAWLADGGVQAGADADPADPAVLDGLLDG